MMSISSEEKIDNYELSVDCLNIERDVTDLERGISFNLNLTDGNGGEPPQEQEEHELNSFKTQIEKDILNILIKETNLKLNNFLNNKEIDFKPFQQDEETFSKNMRLNIEVNSFEKNQFTVKITIRKRPIAYDELPSVILSQKLNEKYKVLFKFMLTINGNKLNFEADEFKILTSTELNDNIFHYNQLLELLIAKNSELETKIPNSNLSNEHKNKVRGIHQNIQEIIELLKADITDNTDTGKDFAISISLTNKIQDTNTTITDINKTLLDNAVKKLLQEINSILESILNKDLVPGKTSPTTQDGLNPELVEKAEKAIRLALSLNNEVELEIEKCVKTTDYGRFPQF